MPLLQGRVDHGDVPPLRGESRAVTYVLGILLAVGIGFFVGWRLCLIGCRNALRTHGIRKRNGDPF